MNLGEWAKVALRQLEYGLAGASNAGVIFPPSPDGIASSVIVEEILSQRGIKSEPIASTPENHINIIENCTGRCDVLLFLDLPPHGRGLLQVAGELFRNVIVVDHGSTPLLSYKNTIRINWDGSGISTSLLAYLVAKEMDENNDLLSWVAASGFYGECVSQPCLEVLKRARTSWPELMREGSIEEIQKAMLVASYSGEEWIYIACSSLRESFDDPGWFLSSSSATASLLRSRMGDTLDELTSLLNKPQFNSRVLSGWEVSEPYQRFSVPLAALEMGVSNFAVSYFYDPPLGLVYVAGNHEADLFTLTRRALGEVEGSIFGGRGFSSIILDSERIEYFLGSLAEVLKGD